MILKGFFNSSDCRTELLPDLNGNMPVLRLEQAWASGGSLHSVVMPHRIFAPCCLNLAGRWVQTSKLNFFGQTVALKACDFGYNQAQPRDHKCDHKSFELSGQSVCRG